MASANQIKRAVRDRDGNRCVRCGMTNEHHREWYGRQLQVHRKVPRSPYSLEGCETVCIPCHGRLPRTKRRADVVDANLGVIPPAIVGIDRELHRKARALAILNGERFADYLDGILREVIEREFNKAFASRDTST